VMVVNVEHDFSGTWEPPILGRQTRGLLVTKKPTKKVTFPATIWNSTSLDLFDIAKLKASNVSYAPFRHLIVEEFIPPAKLALINRDFPPLLAKQKHVDDAELTKRKQIFGFFEKLLHECKSLDFRKLVEDKFAVRLSKTRPRVSLRGLCDPCNGKFHVDGKWKRITYLLYLNEGAIKGKGGNLQLHDGNPSRASMVKSSQGTLLIFLNSKNAWHGFTAYSGPRRAIQVNYEVLDMIPADMQQKTLDALKIKV